MPPCLFCQIAAHDIAAEIVFEDEAHVGFLDHRPLFPGHVLVIPRAHVVTLMDLETAGVGPLFIVTQRIARALEVGLGADGVFVANNNRVSQSVAHLHVHVVPRRKKDGLKGFFWPRVPYASAASMRETRDRIAAAVVEASPSRGA
jgi:histidine triad (HIT) family protein